MILLSSEVAATGVSHPWRIAVSLEINILLLRPYTPGCLGAQFGNCDVDLYFHALWSGAWPLC